MAKRAPSFTITAAGDRVKLDDAGEARAPFMVTNTSPQALQGQLLARPREPAKPEWFSVVGESMREFAPNAAEQVVVQLKVPRGSPPGSYSFRLDAVSEDDPDEDFTEGPSVAFEVPEPPKKKPFPWWIVAVAAGIVLLIIIGVVVWLLVRGSGTATVPAVVGQPEAAAQTMLKDAGFGVKSVQVAVNDQAQNGVVQTQDPAAGTEQPKKTEVTINVGHMVRVPRVTGRPEARAKTELAAANLQADVREVGARDPREDGIVVNQNPAEGTLLPPGGAVTIFVGRTVIVPSVLGRDSGQAVLILEREGLNPLPVRVHVPVPINLGIVHAQSPGGGTRVPLGERVRISFNVFP